MTIFGKILDGEIPCQRVYEDEHVLAFLDVGPLSRGHTLVIPKERKAFVHELSDESAAAVGRVLPRICRAVLKATGQGLVNVLEEMLPELGIDIEGMTYTVIGYGNVGSWTARLLHDLGAKLVGVLDHTGAIRNDHGMDAIDLAEYVAREGGVGGYGNAEKIGIDDFYGLNVDVLVPAALEQMITDREAMLINASVVAEGANAPTTPEGDVVLQQRGIEILPAILCNAGGVTVSYFEWVQDRMGYFWTEEIVNARLEQIMVNAFQDVVDTAEKYDEITPPALATRSGTTGTPRSANSASAFGDVGPFAPSTISFALMRSTFSVVIWFSVAAGTIRSQSSSSCSEFGMCSASG